MPKNHCLATRGASPWRVFRLLATLLGVVLTSSACGAFYWAGLKLIYRKADLPPAQIVRDIAYREGSGADPGKHRLDLFLAAGHDWPTLVFVHGGGWDTGDRALRVGRADLYGNIGRFFASQGVTVAVISYRLVPAVDWRAQIDDVADAVAWVHNHIGERGGRPDAIFLMGHSAGAQLAARVALDPAPLGSRGVPSRAVCGTIGASGAAYDLADGETYRLGADVGYYRERFGKGAASDGDWQREASPIRFVRADAPPFLLLYATGEHRGFRRQAERLAEALREAGASSEVVAVPGQSHGRMVVTLSRPDRTSAPAILAFIRSSPCVASPRTLE